MASFFSAAPTAQNSPELHFRFIDSPIQSSVLKSVFQPKVAEINSKSFEFTERPVKDE